MKGNGALMWTAALAAVGPLAVAFGAQLDGPDRSRLRLPPRGVAPRHLAQLEVCLSAL